MIMNNARALKRTARRRLANGIWDYLMRPGKAGWGRKPFDEEELKLLRTALISQNLCCINGQMVPAFETAFAEAHDLPYGVASTSGTAAIHVALGALDLEPGDEVITAPITDLGTIIPIIAQGCIPVFADIDDTYNIDPEDVARKVTPRTRAILAVHLFGNPCDMDALSAIARQHNLTLIEDCSQAHLAEYRGRKVGTIGHIGCFSFQQSKHMTTGDGGMTITANRQYYERMKLFADKGYARKGYGARAYLFHAPNYRMTELVGAVGLAQLKKLPGVVAKRREIGEYMTEGLSHVPGIATVPITPGGTHSYWCYPILVPGDVNLETLSKTLLAARVNAMVGYTGKPIYLCSDSLTRKKTFGTSEWPFSAARDGATYEYTEGLCPRAEHTLEHLICLPFDESWSLEEARRVTDAVGRALQSTPASSVAAAPGVAQVVVSTPVVEGPPRIRIGIVGCGQMGRWHLDAYKRDSRVEVVAYADSNLASASQFATETGGRAYASHREMLAHERLDGVSICTVPSTHRDITLDVLGAGAHVLCEKPLAMSAPEADVMCNEAADAERLLLTAFKFRFFESVQKARDLVQSKALGPIVNARLQFGGYIDMTDKWYTHRHLSGGGVLIDNGAHAFDLIRFVFGEIASVSALTSAHQKIDVEDTATVTCTLADGGVAALEMSWTLPMPPQHFLEIYGEQGSALLDGEGISYKLQGWSDWKRQPNTRTVHEAFDQQINHFVSAVNGDRSLITNAEDGWRSQLLIDAAYRSAQSERPVNITDEAGSHGAHHSRRHNETVRAS